MTAHGVITNGTPMNALLTGLSVSVPSVKTNSEGSFEKAMDAVQNGKTKTANKLETESKKFGKNEVRNEMFTGKSKWKEVVNTKQDTEPVDEVALTEAVSGLMVQIRNVIGESLNISDEELTNAMEALDLTDADLLDRDQLQKLFLFVNQVEEPAEFLTNEALFDDFAEMVQAVEQTVREVDLDPETIQKVMERNELLPVDDRFEEKVDKQPISAGQNESKPVTEEASDEENEINQTVTANSVHSKNESDVKADTGSTDSKNHLARAKDDGETKIISTEDDAGLKSTFIDAMTSAAELNGEEAVAASEQVREIANQIIEQIKIVIRPEQTNMELQLNPEHLGRVHLTITEKEGMMTAQFTTQTQVAKEAIESQMAVLRDSLQNQGIRVEAIEVTVSEFGFAEQRDANSQNGQNEPNRRRRQNSLDTESGDSAVATEEYRSITESGFDYSA